MLGGEIQRGWESAVTKASTETKCLSLNYLNPGEIQAAAHSQGCADEAGMGVQEWEPRTSSQFLIASKEGCWEQVDVSAIHPKQNTTVAGKI